MYNINKNQCELYSDNWEEHKSDINVWEKFWALTEIKRKWNWANWFYIKLDRANNEIVCPSDWAYFANEKYMMLCLWIALLRSVHEGLTEKLDNNNTKKEQFKRVLEIFPDVPESIKKFPFLKIKNFKDFRNAVFHCQWYYRISKLEMKQNHINKLDELHKNIGLWLNNEFKSCYQNFIKRYNAPIGWEYLLFGKNNVFEDFY